jgi:phenylalanyl-tRNA synthetase alpha subunit
MNDTLEEYFEALERLKSNNPINVPKNSKINNDSVALEAGRKRGSIKKSREMFVELIEAINNASQESTAEYDKLESKIHKLKSTADNYKEMYEKAINRELMYLARINELEKLLKKKNSLSLNNEFYGQMNK